MNKNTKKCLSKYLTAIVLFSTVATTTMTVEAKSVSNLSTTQYSTTSRPIYFSFDGSYIGRIKNSTPSMEYSIDNGVTYKEIFTYDVALTPLEIASLTAESGIKLRMKGDSNYFTTVPINPSPKAPDVTGNDTTNTISGLDYSMEFSINGGGWSRFTGANITDLSGNSTVLIRKMATGNTLAGLPKTLVFTTTNPGPNVTLSFDGPNANKLMGTTTDMEYSLNNCKTWLPVTVANMPLFPKDIGPVAICRGVKVRTKGSSAITTITIYQRTAPLTAWGDNNKNTIIGIDESMEFSLDGTNWTRYNGSNLPVFSGNVNVWLRVAATGTTLIGATKIMSFTEN